ncbi:MAG: nickel-dependent lactate racemase [bacterium]
MRIKIPFAGGFQIVEVPDECVGGILHANEVPIGDETEAIKKSVDTPRGSPPLSKFLARAGLTLIVVNDGMRATPTPLVLDVILPYLQNTDYTFIVATGSHRAPNEDELLMIFGDHLEKLRERIVIHDSRSAKDMVTIGFARQGYPIRVNRKVLEADRLITINSVEPHFFAGFTGGRKSILPGVSAYETIEDNHSYAMSPASKPLALEGNPVHEGMVDAVRFLSRKPIFSIQAVTDKDGRLYAVESGDITASFEASVVKAREVFCLDIERKFDIVVAVAPFPFDADLYQLQKPLEHARLALNEGGHLILVSECRDGIGPDVFHRLMSACRTKEEMLLEIARGYKLGYHKVIKLIDAWKKHRICAVTNLDDDTLRTALIEPAESVQSALDRALQEQGQDTKILFLMQASITVPVLG